MAKPKRTAAGTWAVRYRDPEGNQHQRTFPTLREANIYQANIRTAINDGSYLNPALANTPFTEAAGQWLTSKRGIKPSTHADYEQTIRVHLAPRIGHLPVGHIRHGHVDEMIAAMTADGVSPRVVGKAKQTASAVFKWAMRMRLCQFDPTVGCEVPRQPPAEMLWLTPAEVGRVAAAASRHGDVIEFLAYTGLRWGEMAALDVGDVDLLRQRVRVAKSVDQKGRVDTTKSRRTRWVPLEPSLLTAVVGRMAGKAPSDPLFCGRDGARLGNSNFTLRVWKPALAAAGVDGRVRLHDLRHSCATWLIESGVDVVKVSRWLGHAKPSITLDVYAHLYSEDMEAGVVALSQLRGSDATGPATVAKVEEL